MSRLRIRIVTTPPGDAPRHVRDAWLGLVLPVEDGTKPVAAITQSVLTGPRGLLNFLRALVLGRLNLQRGYRVVAVDAVEALETVNPDAAAWWRANTPHLLEKRRCFLFAANVCEPVSEEEWADVSSNKNDAAL